MKKFILALMACAFVAPAFAADASAPMDHTKMDKKPHHRVHKPHKEHDAHKKDMKKMQEHHKASAAQ
jgi:Ni/Co efflux regulator RcnB